MLDERIYDPVKDYNQKYKKEYLDLLNNYLEDKIKEAGVDEEANKIAVKKYKELSHKNELLSSKRSLVSFFYYFCIVVAIILAVVVLFQLLLSFSTNWRRVYQTGEIIGFFVICPIISIGLFVLAFAYLKKDLKAKDSVINDVKNKMEEEKRKAQLSLKDLKARFDYDVAVKLINKLNTIISLDSNFDSRKVNFLNYKYGLPLKTSEKESSLFVRSGLINKNPFLIYRNLVQYKGNKTYTGSKTVTVRRVYTDKNGTHVRYVSETLRASISKPAPFYSSSTILIYGNENAPNLVFTRSPQEINKIKNEKEYQKAAAKAFKELRKKAEQELMDGKKNPYQPIQNDDFETSFGCINRNNEREFRILFTPVSQLSMENLLRNSPYGDDFVFSKNYTLNLIKSNHVQYMDLINDNFSIYLSLFDLEEIKKSFITINSSYFESIFFLLAPVLAIPCYQNDPPNEYIYDNNYLSNFSDYQIETMANRFKSEYFLHKESKTRGILKVKNVVKNNDVDRATIVAHSFKTIPHIEYVSAVASDGSVHQVPVKWYEYIPVEKETEIVLKENKSSRFNFYFSNNNQSINNFRNYLQNNKTSSTSILYDRILAFIGREESEDLKNINQIKD